MKVAAKICQKVFQSLKFIHFQIATICRFSFTLCQTLDSSLVLFRLYFRLLGWFHWNSLHCMIAKIKTNFREHTHTRVCFCFSISNKIHSILLPKSIFDAKRQQQQILIEFLCFSFSGLFTDPLLAISFCIFSTYDFMNIACNKSV